MKLSITQSDASSNRDFQPRSGVRLQPTAQAVGRRIKRSSPGGAKEKHSRSMPARRVLHALILLAAVFLFLGADTDARFKDLGHRMMCTCGCGQVLLECNHVGCQSSDKMRNQLLAALDKGDNDDLILQGFVQEYGPTVIAAPTATGFNRIAWIMPFVVLALGIAFAIHIVRSWKNRPTPALADGIVIPPGQELDSFRAQARKETDL
jgi:cytochrome c-type biogenesis protein CcmH/NrfF